VNVNGEYYLIDSDDICMVNDEYVLTQDCVYDDISEEYILETDSVTLNYGDYDDITTHIDNCTEIDNEYYLNEDTVICGVTGANILKVDATFCESCKAWFLSIDIVIFNGQKFHFHSRELIRERRKYPRNKRQVTFLNSAN